jgi:DNA mismatch repair protein MutS
LRQSLVNTNRYTTSELSEYESKVITAREKINEIEEEVFYDVKDKVLDKIKIIQENAKIIAILDVVSSFAYVSIHNHYIKPELDKNNKILIKEGRHPVVEKKMDSGNFIPNDLDIDNDNDYMLIITGPNMSGKSTYLRQNALIVFMAQIGCFVPASFAHIGIVDRIFTRIGTSDNLARGQSTFLVEMTETANILKNATSKSLIIMDEIGRGTSTYDGLSIAWAVLEYIHNKKVLGEKTLFATHYHELTSLENKKGIKNLSIAISEENDRITFLHKIVEGASAKSYGIHVAELAGMPEELILYAEGLLNKLEKNKNTEKIDAILKNSQLELFNTDEIKEKKIKNDILDKIIYLNLNKITPIDALNIINDIQKQILKK